MFESVKWGCELWHLNFDFSVPFPISVYISKELHSRFYLRSRERDRLFSRRGCSLLGEELW